MQIPKPTDDDDKVNFRALMGAFVNGNMFAGLFRSSVGVRLLDENDRATSAATKGSGRFGPTERAVSG